MFENLIHLTNTTLPAGTGGSWEPLINLIHPVVGKIVLLLGGIVGIYILILILRLNYERKKYKALKNILYDLDQLNTHYGVKTSKDNKGIIHKLIKKIIKREKKNNKEYHPSQNSQSKRVEIWK